MSFIISCDVSARHFKSLCPILLDYFSKFWEVAYIGALDLGFFFTI